MRHLTRRRPAPAAPPPAARLPRVDRMSFGTFALRMPYLGGGVRELGVGIRQKITGEKV